jgi:uncharacterized protein (UPF0216 family)
MFMTNHSNQADRLLKKQILSLNRHLPRQRKNLKELLEEDKPHVMGVDGTRQRFKTSEIKKIAEIIPTEEQHLLKLPIYLEIESQTSGTRISGKLELKVVCHILNLKDCRSEKYIYRPEMRILRKELPTTTQYIFLVR